MPELETYETPESREDIELTCCSYNLFIDLLQPIPRETES
jgi:hypothetical protein